MNAPSPAGINRTASAEGRTRRPCWRTYSKMNGARSSSPTERVAALVGVPLAGDPDEPRAVPLVPGGQQVAQARRPATAPERDAEQHRVPDVADHPKHAGGPERPPPGMVGGGLGRVSWGVHASI